MSRARILVTCLLTASVLLGLSHAAWSADAALSLADLRAAIDELKQAEADESRRREAGFLAEEKRQAQRTREAEARRDAAEARSQSLDSQWQNNEKRIAELGELLKQHQGNLGELFGVTRQVAGDAANLMEQSLLGAQYGDPAEAEDRPSFLKRLAAAKTLPSMAELQRLWFEIQREMTGSGEVVRFPAEVLQRDGTTVEREDVVRIGPFSAVAGGEPLGYLPNRGILARLEGRLPRSLGATASRLEQAAGEAGYLPAAVDPSRGALLGLYLQRPDLLGRIEHGGAVGYVILAVGAIGFLAGIYQYVYLFRTRRAVDAQLRDASNPRRNNPLGRLLLALEGNDHGAGSVDLAELRISEAVLREVPALERFQSFLRLVVAAGPLLGLIGTVIGMIITFKAITAAGTSDPKLMAHGIGQAMIATVLGLGVAIPLLFVNAALGAASNRIGQVLNEEGQALLARVTDPTASAAGLQRPHTEDASRSGDAPQIGAAFG